MSGALVVTMCLLLVLAAAVGFGLGWYFRGDVDRQKFEKIKPKKPESN